jgi:arsenate reductase
MSRPKVLFLCTGNTARSQMAEAFLKKHAGERFEVYSAGLEPGVLNPYTVRVMEEKGTDMSGHHAKDLDQFLGKVQFDYAITVCDRAQQKCPIFPGATTRLFWPFEDPAPYSAGDEATALARFREVRDQIERRIVAWLQELSPGQ